MAGRASGHDLSRVGHAVIVSPDWAGRVLPPASAGGRGHKKPSPRHGAHAVTDGVTPVRHVNQGPCPRAELGDCVTLDLSYQGCSPLPDNMPLTGLSLAAPPDLP